MIFSSLRFFIILAGLLISLAFINTNVPDDDDFITYTVHTKEQNLKLYWKNDKGEIIQSFENLIKFLKKSNKTLVFAMNGGMYTENRSPLGLYIEDYKTIVKLNKSTGSGNFYMKPNGVFYLKDNNVAGVCITDDFKKQQNVKYATQSGPMLVIDGQINPKFSKGGTSLYVRNGVGILADGSVFFAMSKNEISFYSFALFFKSKGCSNALYLDGAVSRTYLPEKHYTDTDGEFGVIIGVSKDN
jgi:uncharacterized protein YigE (DUF2233 family)